MGEANRRKAWKAANPDAIDPKKPYTRDEARVMVHQLSANKSSYDVVGSRSVYAKAHQSHSHTCNCGTVHNVTEYREPLINDAGTIEARCKVCQLPFTMELRMNVDGFDHSEQMEVIDTHYYE